MEDYSRLNREFSLSNVGQAESGLHALQNRQFDIQVTILRKTKNSADFSDLAENINFV